ncbi:MAG: hypothetical protein LC792_02085 [Actinobacteria bacterium]|nr:hypothetical protein [Actinomycetota bacterium]
MIGLRRRPRLIGVLAALALAVAPALPNGFGAQAASSAPTNGYWFVAADGGIFSYGDSGFFGSTGALKLNQPIVGMAPTPTGRGYWFVAADGGVFSFGDAGFYGSTGKLKLNRPIVGMAPTPSGRGYWFVASDGGIFSFGDAQFYGSTGAIKLAKPIVGMAATPTGRGYWFVASDGGIFSYGDAQFFGAAAGKARSPIVSMTSSPTGKGYYLASADGTVFSFGDAVFRGSMGGQALKSPIAGISLNSSGAGYWLVAADGGIFSFGDAKFFGSAGALKLNRAIVGMAAAPQKSAGGTTLPGGTPGGTLPGGTPGSTAPGGTPGGTDPGTTPTTLPPNPAVNWGDPGATSVVARAGTGGGNAFRPWLSGDGRYLVFDSDGTKVLPGDTTKIRDVYLYDRVTGAMERISNGLNGARAAGTTSNCNSPTTSVCGSQRATISADGRYVAFWSNATNLVPNDTNGKYDAFLFDRQTHTMSLVSTGYQGAPANGSSRRPVVSRDGTSVVFESEASNLIAPESCTGVPILGRTCTGGDKNNADDVFVYDIAGKTVSLVSADANGASAAGASNRPSLSINGRRIVFQSEASNLVSGDTNGKVDIFMRDMSSGTNTIVSSGPEGQANNSSRSPSISADGSWVSFDSDASNFVSGDSGNDTDVYLKNVDSGAIEQVSVRSGGGQITDHPSDGVVGSDSSVSNDGRFVAFWSSSSTLVDGDTNGTNCTRAPCADVFVRDRAAGTTSRITSTNGVQGDNDTFSPALSLDGRFVAVDSKATTLDPSGGGATTQDVFVHVNF